MLHLIFKRALAPWAPPAGPVTLAWGGVVVHRRAPIGGQRATPTPGAYAMTPAEWAEYKGARHDSN
jgi:hypothetical protein